MCGWRVGHSYFALLRLHFEKYPRQRIKRPNITTMQQLRRLRTDNNVCPIFISSGMGNVYSTNITLHLIIISVHLCAILQFIMLFIFNVYLWNVCVAFICWYYRDSITAPAIHRFIFSFFPYFYISACRSVITKSSIFILKCSLYYL